MDEGPEEIDGDVEEVPHHEDHRRQTILAVLDAYHERGLVQYARVAEVRLGGRRDVALTLEGPGTRVELFTGRLGERLDALGEVLPEDWRRRIPRIWR